MKWIDNWRSVWRYFVVQIGAALVAWSMVPEETWTAIMRLALRLLNIDESMLPALMGVPAPK